MNPQTETVECVICGESDSVRWHESDYGPICDWCLHHRPRPQPVPILSDNIRDDFSFTLGALFPF